MHGPMNVKIDGDTAFVRHTCVALSLVLGTRRKVTVLMLEDRSVFQLWNLLFIWPRHSWL